jgi:hypothetical protein
LAEKSKPKHPTIKFVYIGVREDGHPQFYEVGDDGELKKKLWSFTAKGLTGLGNAGAIYRFKQPHDSPDSILTHRSNREYVGQWSNESDVVAWQAASEAARAVYRAEKRRKKETGVNRFKEQLEPVRLAYSQARGLERHTLLALVVAYITQAG